MGKSASEATVHGSDGKAVSKNQQRMHTEKEVGVIERLVTEENFLGWDKNDQLMMNLDESDSVSKLSSVSMRVDSKISLQQAMIEEQKKQKAQNKDKNVKRHMHQLKCRVEGAFLPLSVDLLPSNDIQKARHRINNNIQFDKVLDLNIREVDEQNFISQLHGIEVAKIDKILAKDKLRQAKKQTEDTSKTDTQTPDLSGTDKDELKKSDTKASESINLSMSESSLAQPDSTDKQNI